MAPSTIQLCNKIVVFSSCFYQEDHKKIKNLEKEVKDAAAKSKPAGPSAEEVSFLCFFILS